MIHAGAMTDQSTIGFDFRSEIRTPKLSKRSHNGRASEIVIKHNNRTNKQTTMTTTPDNEPPFPAVYESGDDIEKADNLKHEAAELSSSGDWEGGTSPPPCALTSECWRTNALTWCRVCLCVIFVLILGCCCCYIHSTRQVHGGHPGGTPDGPRVRQPGPCPIEARATTGRRARLRPGAGGKSRQCQGIADARPGPQGPGQVGRGPPRLVGSPAD
jgi:hypothetical protein